MGQVVSATNKFRPPVSAASADTGGARTPQTATALAAQGIAKAFGGAAALTGVDLTVERGSIHALLGGNGSGKSTLIKCLAGVYQADGGTISVHGESLSARQMTPRRAREAGLRFVHQDLAVFDSLTVAENFALDSGFPTNPAQGIRWRELRSRAEKLLDFYGISARATDTLGSLRPSQKTMVAVARALADQQGSEFILLLDEPTASLPEDESRELMAALRTRADRGQTIVLVTHRFGEIAEVADEVTVFRDGSVAGRGPVADMTTPVIVSMMAGTDPSRTPAPGTHAAGTATRPAPSSSSDTTGTPVFTGSSLARHPLVGVDLTVAPGEIVGLAGLAGSGRSTVLRAIFGDTALAGGTMALDGAPHAPASPADAIRSGIAYVPEDRHRDAAFLDLAVRENASATVIGRYWRRLVMNLRLERSDTEQLITEHSVRTDGPEAPIGRLSGGNQQKVILARWLRRNPRLLLLDEPTQGVDVMSRQDIYRTLRGLAGQGCGILVASSDLDELVELCDRVLVLVDGRITAEFDPDEAGRGELATAVMSAAPARPAPHEGSAN